MTEVLRVNWQMVELSDAELRILIAAIDTSDYDRWSQDLLPIRDKLEMTLEHRNGSRAPK